MHMLDLQYESPLSMNTSRINYNNIMVLYDGINWNIHKLYKDKCIFPDDKNL